MEAGDSPAMPQHIFRPRTASLTLFGGIFLIAASSIKRSSLNPAVFQ